MRIVHVTDCYLPRLGGIELHIRDLAHHQRLAGHQVTVVTRTPADPDETDSGQSPERLLRVSPWSTSWLHDLAPDVIHVHLSVLSPFALTAARRSSRSGIPTVATVHSLWSDLARVAPLIRTHTGIHRWPIIWTAVSEQAAVHVCRVVANPVGVIPNAIDLDAWTPAVPSCPVVGMPPQVLSVMRLTTVKRARALGRILCRVAQETDLRAVIVGDGPERRALEDYLRRHRLTDRVRLTGATDREQVRRHMQASSIFLAPARRESFGIAALEARATGLPIVAYASSGIASFVTHGREGLLGDNDDDLADHTLDLLHNTALREQIAHHNRAVPPMNTWQAALTHNDAAYQAARAAEPQRLLPVRAVLAERAA